MPSELTQVEVWNLALDHIREKPLSTISDDRAEARWLTRNFGHIRDTTTRAYPWNFAKQLNELTEDATAPAYKWDYRYALPDDWLRVLPPTYLGGRGANPIPHEVLGGYILCNIPTTLYLETIQRVEDVTKWDSLAIDALALFLAYRMTFHFTHVRSLRADLYSEFTETLRVATEIDTLEGSAEPVEQHDVIDVRSR